MEKSMKRSIRRHHKERLKEKRKDYCSNDLWNEEEQEERCLCISIDTPKRCSCWMCGNPRRYMKGKEKYTIQELKHNIELREELE